MQESVTNPSTDNQEFSEKFPHHDLFEALKNGRKKYVAWALLCEYFSNANISCLRYIADQKRHWSERLFWVIAFIVSLCLSGVLIWEPWQKWNKSPVIVAFDEKETPVWKIPFPAVTICPETKFLFDHLNNDIENKNLRDDMISRMHDAEYRCFPYVLNNITGINDRSLKIEDTMIVCIWHYNEDCLPLFKPILTEEGICFTFNALNSRDIYTDAMDPEIPTVADFPNVEHWSPEKGYDEYIDTGFDAYPYRVLSAGAHAGLKAELFFLYKHDDFTCREPVEGFKILLHNADEVPQISKYYFHLPSEHEIVVSIQPQMITTKDELRKYDHNTRGCYFNSECSLKFFKTYNQRNCELERLANFTKSRCGCVKFSMPREKDTPICGIDEIQCSEEAEIKMLESSVQTSKEEVSGNVCNCLPTCTSITYNAEISQSEFPLRIDDANELYPGAHLASLKIFFKEYQFTTSKRSELYGANEFLANCGCLLSLCIGISVLGIVEIIYFFTLRLCCTIQMHKPRKEE